MPTTTRILFSSPSGAEPGSERYFEEAIAAGFYGVPDDESYAFTSVPVDPFEAPECCQ